MRVGITDYAQRQLGDVVYVQLPLVGDSVAAGEPVGEVESTKSVSELFAPVAGEVVACNDALQDNPELVNSDPYGVGWMIEVKLAEAVSGGLVDGCRGLPQAHRGGRLTSVPGLRVAR